VADAIQKLKCVEILLDGEVVALDELGRSFFQRLQRINAPGVDGGNLFYYVFDLLNLNGRDATGLPLSKRKALLELALKGAPDCVRISGFLPGEAGAVSEKL